MFQVGDNAIHKTGGKTVRIVWIGPVECKVRWKDRWNFVRPHWYDRQTKEAWNYIPTRDLRPISEA